MHELAKKNICLDMGIFHENVVFMEVRDHRSRKMFTCCFTSEENFREKPGVSRVMCSVICHAGVWFHRILPESELQVSNSC